MAKIHVTGNGPLRGVVSIAGAKNAALPVIAASLLSEEPLELENVPGVKDIDTCLQLLELLGCTTDRNNGCLSIDSSAVHSVRAPYDLVKTMRQEGVRAIFAETTLPTALAEAVAGELGERVTVVELFTGSLGEPQSDAGTLAGMLETNARLIADALGG